MKIDKQLLFGVVIGILIIYFIQNLHKFYCQQSNQQSQQIKTLIRQAARWSAASLQDETPLIAVLHAVYGAGYLWALKDIATDDQIVKFVDPKRFETEITKTMDVATKRAVAACPQYAGDVNKFLSQLAGEM